MRGSSCLFAVAVAVVAAATVSAASEEAAAAAATFREWAEAQGSDAVYADDESFAEREGFYHDSLEEALDMNDVNPEALFGANSLADWSPEDFRSLLAPDTPSADAAGADAPVTSLFPAAKVRAALKAQTAVDYVARGDRLPPVREQHRGCASGYAHAAAAAVEAHRAHAGWGVRRLSVGQLVHCDGANQACAGGSAERALEYAARTKMFTEVEFRTVAGTVQDCKKKWRGRPSVSVGGVGHLPNQEGELLVFLAEYGPFVANICAEKLRTYVSGVISDCDCSGHANHAVVVVGSGLTDPGDKESRYWIVRNSWGTGWGEGGHARLRFGHNVCGVANSCVFGMVDPPPSAGGSDL
eukprot:Rhum_TRINITY_DN15145_c4_g2::Rhum_TRINITY_DN15145_c4_g2_i1::g.138678::m.138678/K01374/CTSO; cathepsin O